MMSGLRPARAGVLLFLVFLLLGLPGCFKAGSSAEDILLGVVAAPGTNSGVPTLALTPPLVTLVVNTVAEFSTSGGVPPYVYSVTSGGGSFSGDFYTAPGTPGIVLVQVQDTVGNFGTAQITVNPPLEISPTAAQTIAVNNSVGFTGSGGVPPYTFTVISGGGTFAGGLFTGPSINDVATVAIIDSQGNQSPIVTVTINPPISVIPTNATVGTSGTVVYSAADGVPPYTFKVISGGGSFSGTTYTAPTLPGTVTIQAKDADGNTANSDLTIISALAINPVTQTVQVGSTINFQATGGTPPYTFIVISGSGTMLGSTYTAPSSPGTDTVQVTDNAFTTSNATITINPALAISPTSKTMVTNGTVAFSATGGVPPYTYSVLSGDGTVSGSTYTAPTGSGGPVVQVTDSASDTSVAAVNVLAIASISAGSYSTCGAFSDGSVQCWGNNELGQLGNGATSVQSGVPVAPTGVGSVSQIAVSAVDSLLYNHACALSVGTVQCWGDNSVGELGTGNTSSSSSPVSVTGLSGVTQISTGLVESCALISGAIKCWGLNSHGGVGDGTLAERNSPTSVSGISTASAIATGSYSSCALLSGGSVKCWGDNSNGQLGNASIVDSSTPVPVSGISTATAIAVGLDHACALLTGGTVSCWGLNASGQLGNASTVDSSSPVPVSGISNAIAISAGNSVSCALLSTGVVQCWGTNSAGQLGASGSYVAASSVPVNVSGITTAVAVSVGGTHVCALLADNSMHCWGDNSFGELGNGNSGTYLAPVAAMTGLTQTSSVSMSPQAGHACALQSTGSIQCSGNDYLGTLGDGVTLQSEWLGTLASVSGITTASQLAVGNSSACALLSGGALKCWGDNSNGQLGNNSAGTNSSTPVSVSGVSTATQIAASQFTACAVLSGHTVQCWGKGANGALGNGGTADSPIPVNVSGISTATQVAVGKDHACALLTGGAVQCWGNNSNGQLGNLGAGATSTTPVTVTGLTATQIAADDESSCALVSGGTIQCWGAGGNGGLGNAGTSDSTTTVGVSGIATATALSAGQFHFCALLTGGAVKCWGSNRFGQVGTGGLATAVSTPAAVSGVSGATSIATGATGSCARISASSVLCWGDNSGDEFGLGSAFFGVETAPVQVVFP